MRLWRCGNAQTLSATLAYKEFNEIRNELPNVNKVIGDQMDFASGLELCMRDALKENNIFFDEQVYVRTQLSFYIFDFVVYGECCKIIVECDGPHHYNLERWFLDSRRDLWCIQNGYHDILRFSAPQIVKEIDLCIGKIKCALEAYDLALGRNDYLREAIKLERQKITTKQASRKTEGTRSKYSGLRVEISAYETKESKQENHLEKVNLLSIEKENDKIKNSDTDKRGRSTQNSTSDEEHLIWNVMKGLPIEQKRLLWKIIKKSNKDNILVYRGSSTDLNFLIRKKLLVVNPYYKPYDNEISVFVLPQAPNIMRFLKGNDYRSQ